VFHPGNGTVDLAGGTIGNVIVHFSGGTLGDEFRFYFLPPPHERLRQGFYPGAVRGAGQTAGRPAMDIFGDGRGCNELTGSFDVLDLRIGADGSIERLWLTYEQHCEGGAPALFGEVRVNVPSTDDELVVGP
jgi:hypothetical protein